MTKELDSENTLDLTFRCPRELAEKRLPSGRLTPVFPLGIQNTQKEEDYITRMILRDREYERKG